MANGVTDVIKPVEREDPEEAVNSRAMIVIFADSKYIVICFVTRLDLPVLD